MTTQCETLQAYYDSWVKGSFSTTAALFAKGFHFEGPMEKTDNVSAFLQLVEQMVPTVKSIEFQHKLTTENHAIATYTLEMNLPIKPLRCCEIFTFENGLIKSIELYFDPSELVQMMASQAAA